MIKQIKINKLNIFFNKLCFGQSGATTPESAVSVTRKVVNLSLISKSKSKQNQDHPAVTPVEQTSAAKGAVISLSHLKKQRVETSHADIARTIEVSHLQYSKLV